MPEPQNSAVTTCIRPARLDDCTEIARLQVNSYRSSYIGFFPQAYLDHFTYEEQTQDWLDLLQSGGQDIILVAEMAESRLAGYVLARVVPDCFPGYAAEIVGLHVAREHQRQGIGSRLLLEAVNILRWRGCQSVMLWTLAGNPARQWYERLGGHYLGEKVYWVDDWEVTEVAYGWNYRSFEF